jgi:hypothetical protein
MSYIGVQMARSRGVEDTAEKKAVTTRPSSTANFLIDSFDRDGDAYPSSGDFQIVKKQSIFNGFFNRMAMQEVVLDWGIPNISSSGDVETSNFSISYDDNVNPPVEHTISIPDGFYTVEKALDTIVSQLNVSVGTPGAFVITSGIGTTGPAEMEIDQAVVPGGTFEILLQPTLFPLQNNLGSLLFAANQLDNGYAAAYPVMAPNLLPFRYLDFVCNQLTYNQELKDGDTSEKSRDVLYRWYFGWDNETAYDGYGYPILQGYRQFRQRRLIAYPKQIRWQSAQPVGNLSFQVYNDRDEIVDATLYTTANGGANMEFQMTLLLSED